MTGSFTPRGWINGEVWDAAAVIDVETRLGAEVNAKATDGQLATHAATQPAHGADLAGTPRPPTAHAGSHAAAGADPITIATSQVPDGAITLAKVNADVPLPPVGTILPFAGINLPANGKWAWADGSLIDRTTYATFMSAVGHAYNGGVDPGSNMVRVPDKRGRVSIGANSYGAGSAGTGNARGQAARGANGGEVLHTLTTAEAAQKAVNTGGRNVPHVHTPDSYLSDHGGGWAYASAAGPAVIGISQNNTGTESTDHQHAIAGSSAASGHNVLNPYEADNYIVRII